MKKISTLIVVFTFTALGLSAQAPKKVILEDYTGSWCGFCPRGLTVSNQIEATQPNVIALGVHQGASASSDAMATPYSNDVCNLFAAGYPNGGIDRVKFPGQTDVGQSTNLWAARCSQRLIVSAPLNVFISSTYNQTSRVVDITVTANFVAAANGDFRIHCLLAEDSLTGVGAGWDQHNYMGQGCSSADPSSPWYSFPCNIVGYNHRHVVREQLANDFWGEAGIIPASPAAGQNFSKTFTYTLPQSWDEDQMEIVAFVSNYGPTDADRSILNSNKVELGGTVSGISNPSNGIPVITGLEQNYPNPFSDFTNIKFQLAGADHVVLKVYDLLGKEITTLVNEKLSGGEYNFIWDGTNSEGTKVNGGLYFYRLSSGSQLFTGQMTLIRK